MSVVFRCDVCGIESERNAWDAYRPDAWIERSPADVSAPSYAIVFPGLWEVRRSYDSLSLVDLLVCPNCIYRYCSDSNFVLKRGFATPKPEEQTNDAGDESVSSLEPVARQT